MRSLSDLVRWRVGFLRHPRTGGQDFLVLADQINSETAKLKVEQVPTYQMSLNGVLIVDKPAGLTSHDVVNRVRRILGTRAVGHVGTLDPMATGVLPLVIGTLTRLAQFYTSGEKSYEGVIRFGFGTDTYDRDGKPTGAPQPVRFSLDELRESAGRFRGVIEQVPPPFSAKKVDGVPAYKLARKQKEFTLRRVQVEVKEF